MSVEFFEGFETCGTETGLANEAITRPRVNLRWDATGSGGLPSSDSFFLIDDNFGEGFALQMTSNNFGSSNFLQWNVPVAKQEAPGASARTWAMGTRFHVPTGLTTQDWNIFLVQGEFGGSFDTDVISLSIHDGTDVVCLRANPGAFTIATAADVVTPGAWHYIEWKFKIAEEADGGFIEVKLDGNEIIPFTAADTNNALTLAFEELVMQTLASTTGTQFVAYDDIYVVDTSVSPHNNYLGPVRVRSLPPDGDQTKDWDITDMGSGDNYEQVDENGADDADYVETDRNADRDRYTVTDTVEPDEVVAVKVEAEVINETGGFPSLVLELVSGASTETADEIITNTTAYDLITMIVEDDPQGGAWTITDVDALRVGYQFKNNLT